MIGFIDLLGTKDSSKISEDKFYTSIRRFLFTLMNEIRRLPEDSYSIQYLSDSAFFELQISEDSFSFLRKLRGELFRDRIFFKCALIVGELKPQNITQPFIENLFREFSSSYLPDSLDAEEISKNFKGFFFSRETISAYLLHEKFKGVGYIATPDLVRHSAGNFVSSIYYTSDTFKSYVPYNDIRYRDPQEVANWSEAVESEWDVPVEWDESMAFIRGFVAAAEVAAYKKGSYSKYYIPALISMIRSAQFDSVAASERSLVGTPVVFRQLVSGAKRGKAASPLKGVFDLHCAILNEVLTSVRQRIHESSDEAERQAAEDTQRLVCKTFLFLPGFKSSIQHSKPSLLTSSNRETFLETIVGS